MLDAANVLVDRKPVVRLRGIKRSLVVFRVGITVEIPRRIDERIHGVGFTPCRVAALRTFHIQKFRHVAQRRAASNRSIDFVRQNHGQVLFRNRHNAILFAIDHGNRRAPETLPRDTPVFQTVRDSRLAKPILLRMRRHLFHGVFATKPCKLAGIYQHAFLRSERGLLNINSFAASARLNHLPNFQAILRSKLVITLVMRGHGHNRSRAVIHQNVVRNPNRHTLTAKRVDGKASGWNTMFLNRPNVADFAGLFLLRNQLIDFRSQLRTSRR